MPGRKVYRTVCLDLQFWIAVISGWIICVLVWNNDPEFRNQADGLADECLPCVEKICPKCAAKQFVEAKSIAKNEFYRDYAWKPQNVVEDQSNNWRMSSINHRDGMTNEDPRVGLNGMWRLEREEIGGYLKNVIKNTDLSESINDVKFKRMMRKSDPFYGVSYIVNIDTTYHDKTDSICSAYEVRRKFKSGKPNLVDITHLDEKEMVYIIIPLSKVTERFHKFLKRIEESIYSGKKVSYETWIFVIFGDPKGDDAVKTVSAIQGFQQQNPAAIMKHTFVSGGFNRAIGLDTGVKMCPDNGLMVFLDTDISITPEVLNRIRANTVQDKRVVFPIVFSQYDPDIVQEYKKTIWANEERDDSPIGESKGFWIHYAFGITSMYKSDYLSVGGFPLDIVGWGGEDVALFEKMIASPSLDAMSTVEPGMIHFYHSRACDVSLAPDQYRMCVGSLSETIGSQKEIGSLYLKEKSKEYFGGMFG